TPERHAVGRYRRSDCVAKASRFGTRPLQKLLTLLGHMDTSPPDINLCAIGAIDIMQDLVWPCLTAEVRLSKRNEPPPLLVPQRHPHTAQTLKHGDSSDGGELRMVPQYLRQPIA